MRALIQRVTRAQVSIEGALHSSIGKGYVILLGVGAEDGNEQAEKLWSKISKLRIFEDENGKTNVSLADVQGDVMVVSQFTLHANCKRGNRPSFTEAGAPDEANRLYEYFVDLARRDIEHVATGSFGAMMQVELVNDGLSPSGSTPTRCRPSETPTKRQQDAAESNGRKTGVFPTRLLSATIVSSQAKRHREGHP
ncbi:MAG: D-aminoacyl-tRNA deacylase [Slackia sp.]